MIRNDVRMVIFEESDLNDFGRASLLPDGSLPNLTLKHFNYDLKEFMLMPDLIMFKQREDDGDVYVVLWDKLEIQDMMRQSYLADIYGLPTDEVGKKSYEKVLSQHWPGSTVEQDDNIPCPRQNAALKAQVAIEVEQDVAHTAQLERIKPADVHDDGHPNDGFIEDDFH